jgi:hypothetical protein
MFILPKIINSKLVLYRDVKMASKPFRECDKWPDRALKWIEYRYCQMKIKV